jgi:hypothetical protein
MQTDFHKLKKEFVNKKVADAIQFIENITNTFKTLEHCRDVILALTTEYDKRLFEYNSKIHSELHQKGKASITLVDDSFEILGYKTSLSFLIEKNIKDIIQYANNILDSLAQVVNSALIYPQFPKDKVDFGFLYSNRINRLQNLLTTRNVEQVFASINSSPQFSYLRKSNNRIKHIMDIPTSIGFKLFDEKITALIKEFTKNGITFKDVKTNDKCNDICVFISERIDNVCSAIYKDLNFVNHEYRFNEVNVYAQIAKQKNENIEDINLKNADFLIAYIELKEKDWSKIPSQLELLFASVRVDDSIEVFNYDYELVLLKVGELYEGYAEAYEPVDGDFTSYRKYNIIYDKQAKFHDIMLNKTKMKYYPFASNQQIVFYSDECISNKEIEGKSEENRRE